MSQSNYEKLPIDRVDREASCQNGTGAGIRTPDPRIMIPLLYQLSYTGTAADDSATPPGCPDRPSDGGFAVVPGPISILQALGELLIPRTCRLCLAPPLFPTVLCACCNRDLPRRSSICPRCLHMPGSAAQRCPGCSSQTPMKPLVHISSHEGTLRKLILCAKNGHRDDLGQILALELSRTIVQAKIVKMLSREPIVVAIPRSIWRLVGKGVALSQRIAVPLARSLGLRYQRRLGRRGSLPQVSLPARGRRLLSESAFFVRGSAPAKEIANPPPVILVDDVHTTGATLRAATKTLMRAGFDVKLWVVASVSRAPQSRAN